MRKSFHYWKWPKSTQSCFPESSPHGEGTWGACVWLPPASPFRGEVFVFRGVLNGSPAMEHNPFVAILGSGLAYITIASSGPHKISRKVSMAWKHPVLCEEKQRQAIRPGSRASSPDSRGKRRDVGRGARGDAPSASRTPPPGSALPGGKSPPASFQKKMPSLLVRALIPRKDC